MSQKHNFHIPVMGTGFTLDTPIKVSRYGIDSVISVVDDVLMENLRKMYCEKFEIPYHAISEKIEDFRAKRITSYLNLVNDLATKKFKALKDSTQETSKDLKAYFNLLPDSSSLKKQFLEFSSKNTAFKELKNWLNENLSMGSIDVNIMTKLDKVNYNQGEALPGKYNDAHAALRGFAQSDLSSSMILSAGMNPRLYSYMEEFDDFYPDANGNIRKKIVIKVSDYRSALIQGKFLAKKGLWVSEYRIESGLNCGGHAFASEGFLMGPILEEFKNNRKELIQTVNDILVPALSAKNRVLPKQLLALKITAQGGVGTDEEHNFLMDHYEIDSVGWGTPFLLVPEATTVDDATLDQLVSATEKDLYLSNISPLGIPFNNLRGNSQDLKKIEKVETGRPGSPCPKEFLALTPGFTDKTVCTASRQYQRVKIKELEAENLSKSDYKNKFQKIVEKSCICVGLGTATMKVHGLESKNDKKGVSICPGPNMAYFSKTMSLKEMIDHIYGRINVISHPNRPNMFVKEIKLYIDYLKTKIDETPDVLNKKQEKYLLSFSDNLRKGIEYYQDLFVEMKDKFEETKFIILNDLEQNTNELKLIEVRINKLLDRANPVI